MLAIVIAALLAAPEAATLPEPEWASTPTSEEIAQAYPGAGGLVSEGQATLSCKLTPEGGLTACEVVSEYPHYVGFGAAALKLASKYQANMTPEDKPPPSPGATVQVDVQFPHR